MSGSIMRDQLTLDDVRAGKSFDKLTKINSRVYKLLKEKPELRSSDRKLIWEYWQKFDAETLIETHIISEMQFLYYLTNPETITRAGRKVKELFPELRGDYKIRSEISDSIRENKAGGVIAD